MNTPTENLVKSEQVPHLSLLALYERHQALLQKAKAGQQLTPDEIVDKTWGTIREMDEEVLREIIEDEEYCGY